MLENTFAELFNYDMWANKQMAALINITDDNHKPAELMAHLLVAQQVWLSRCKGSPLDNYQLWPQPAAVDFNDTITKNHSEWINIINSETDAGRLVAYKNSKGERFSSKFVDILSHVINHGTHHRAQIGMLLKNSNAIELPPTDYIYYIRTLQ